MRTSNAELLTSVELSFPNQSQTSGKCRHRPSFGKTQGSRQETEDNHHPVDQQIYTGSSQEASEELLIPHQAQIEVHGGSDLSRQSDERNCGRWWLQLERQGKLFFFLTVQE